MKFKVVRNESESYLGIVLEPLHRGQARRRKCNGGKLQNGQFETKLHLVVVRGPRDVEVSEFRVLYGRRRSDVEVKVSEPGVDLVEDGVVAVA
jgi:hypothetical protein